MRKPTKKDVDEAYDVLGVEHGADLDTIKRSYRKLSLQLHPDKQPPGTSDEPFKRVNSAFEVLKTHLGPRDQEDDLDDLMDGMPFGFSFPFSFMFERMFARQHNHPPGCGCPPGHAPPGYPTQGPPPSRKYDSDDDYEDYDDDWSYARPQDFFGKRSFTAQEKEEMAEARREQARQTLSQQKEAEARRKQEAELVKLKAQKTKAKEQEEAAKRRSEKTPRKRAATIEKSAQAAKEVTARLLKKQADRTAVFALLRGDTNKKMDAKERRITVQKAIWEKEIVVCGWEVLPDVDQTSLKGNSFSEESLLHLAVKANDIELVEWLCTHGAVPEEKDAGSHTAVYRAIEVVNENILTYLFDAYPTIDNDEIYCTPSGGSLLPLAVQSGKAKIVAPLVEHGSLEEVQEGWSLAAKQQSLGIAGEWEAIKVALGKKAGFSPLATPPQTSCAPTTPPSTPRLPGQPEKFVLATTTVPFNIAPNTPPPSQKRKQKKRFNSNSAKANKSAQVNSPGY